MHREDARSACCGSSGGADGESWLGCGEENRRRGGVGEGATRHAWGVGVGDWCHGTGGTADAGRVGFPVVVAAGPRRRVVQAFCHEHLQLTEPTNVLSGPFGM